MPFNTALSGPSKEPGESKHLGMFWRFLFAMFLSSFIGMELNVLGVNFYEEQRLIRQLQSAGFADEIQKELLAEAQTFEHARQQPALCSRTLNSIVANSSLPTAISEKGPNSMRNMIADGRLTMDFASAGQPICRYPLIRQTDAADDKSTPALAAFRYHVHFVSDNKVPNDVVLTLRPLRSPALLWEATKGIPWNVFVVFIVVLNLCCAFTLAPILVRRIKRAEVVARGWTQGHMQARINDTRNDEFGSLVRSFNSMADAFEGVIKTEQELAGVEERNRLARDLHDTAKQRAFALNLQLTALNALRGSNPEQAVKLTGSALSLVRHLQSDLSNVIKRLSASTVVELGTREVLRQELTSLFEGSGIAWDVRIPDAMDILLRRSTALAQPLLLIVIEAAANVLKHSGAKMFSVSLRPHQEGYVLLLEDDGRGFDIANTPSTGMGLASMKLRAQGLPDGNFSVANRTTRGVEIAIHFTIGDAP